MISKLKTFYITAAIVVTGAIVSSCNSDYKFNEQIAQNEKELSAIHRQEGELVLKIMANYRSAIDAIESSPKGNPRQAERDSITLNGLKEQRDLVQPRLEANINQYFNSMSRD